MIKLHNIDCVEFMRSVPDGYYDLAVVDPPYYDNAKNIITPGGNLSTTGVERRKYAMPHWEPPTAEYWEQLFRVSRHQIIWGINYFPIVNPGWGRIVWDKVKDNGTAFSDCEIAYCSLLKHVKIFRYMWNGMLQGRSMHDGTTMQGDKRRNEKRIHPTQKPVVLYDWIFSEFVELANPANDRPVRVLDTHLGSASSAIAVDRYNWSHGSLIDFDGCEIDPAYFVAAKLRFEEFKMQQEFCFSNNQER